MVTVTSIGGRAVALVASALAHVAVAAVTLTGGHAPDRASTSLSARDPSAEIAFDLTPPEPVVEVPAVPAQAPAKSIAGGASQVHTHTHPYPVPLDHDAHPHDPSLVHTGAASHPHDDHVEAAVAPPVAIAASEAAPARFTMVVGAAPTVASGAVGSGARAGDAARDQDDDHDARPIVDGASLVEPARRVSGADPVYPDRARAEGIELDVPVEIIVDERGAVASARATKHVGYGLDDAAVNAVRAWRFAPRTASGKPVRVRLVWPVQFRLTN